MWYNKTERKEVIELNMNNQEISKLTSIHKTITSTRASNFERPTKILWTNLKQLLLAHPKTKGPVPTQIFMLLGKLEKHINLRNIDVR
eukprot:UN24733